MASPDKTLSSTGRLAVLGSTVLLIALLALYWSRFRPAQKTQPAAAAPASRQRIEGTAVKPPRPPDGYVGSEACAACHAAIAESYQKHPMYRSAGSTPGADDVEDFSHGEFTFEDGRIYRVSKEDDGIYHHEIRRGQDGKVVYDEAAKIAYFIGSGTRGKTYAIDREGLLFESPISWFTSAKKWDISPGYSHRHVRFERRIPDHCVLCHAGRVSTDPRRDDTFFEPALLESAIGCERCHGPGQRHVEFRRSTAKGDADDPIVNPADLSADRREAVCYQCHLIGKMTFSRYGRHFDDFRPGDRLDDIWAIFVAGSGIRGDGQTKAVSHVAQMRGSVCYEKSAGRMGCVSCHDAHSVPAKAEVDAYYRQRCLECHADRGCSLPAERQAAAPANNSCIHCHMPRLSAHDIAHASQTDHRILREVATEGEWQSLPEPSDVVLFDRERTTMPKWELERVLALSRVRGLQDSGYASSEDAEALEPILRDVTEIAPDDAATWLALGTLYDLRQNVNAAREAWQKALSIEPRSERTLDLLAIACQKSGDNVGGLEYIDRFLALNPWRARDHMRRASLLAQLGRLPDALAAAETAIELDPTDRTARRWLIDVAKKLGESELVRRHADVMRRLSD